MMVLLENKRNEMFHYFRALADVGYQQRAWVNGEYSPEIGHDNFNYVVTFFFNDTMLAEAPLKMVGTILETQDEVPVVSQVIDALTAVLNHLGDEASDVEYITSAHWGQVVSAAAAAVRYYGL
jgi:hypothetical protein